MIRLINKPITYSRDAASRRGGRAGAGDERSEIRISNTIFFLHSKHHDDTCNWLNGQKGNQY